MSLFINTDVNEQPLYNDQPSTVSLELAVNYMDIDEMDGKITLHCWLSTVSKFHLSSLSFEYNFYKAMEGSAAYMET